MFGVDFVTPYFHINGIFDIFYALHKRHLFRSVGKVFSLLILTACIGICVEATERGRAEDGEGEGWRESRRWPVRE